MKIALLSDIHSNLEAFEATWKSVTDYGAEQILFLGDIVGYGANPNECIDLLTSITDCIIAGNHDLAAVGKADIEYFNQYAREAILWTQQHLTREHTMFLSELPLIGEMSNFLYVHSTPHYPERWDYILTIAEARDSFKHFTQNLCFVAHSHSPLILVQNHAGDIMVEYKTTIAIKKDLRYIINIGSVGQPRDGDCRSSYSLYDTDTQQYRLIRVPYDIVAAQKKIIDAGLPRFLADRLAVGH